MVIVLIWQEWLQLLIFNFKQQLHWSILASAVIFLEEQL